MSNWLKGVSINSSNSKGSSGPPLLYGVDQVAAFNAFVQHWQQIFEIFRQTNFRNKISCDDVTAVINHFGQMVNFLLVDLRQLTSTSLSEHEQRELPPVGVIDGKNGVNSMGIMPHTPIFDHFMGERILQSILQWSMTTGEFIHVFQLEQLKVYEMLISNSHPEILVYKPITEPMLILLESCSGCVPVEVEKRLVVLLNQLWVSLLHNQHLLKYFLLSSDNQIPKFLIFSQLLPFIHREGGIGHQARDTLLLAMSLSASHSAISDYVTEHSNFCPVLAAGLSGLYSMLPRSLNIRTEGWYRISPDDVPHIPSLQMFISSLEFCNAIVQLAHPRVKRQLVDYLYQGFLVPVVGPALNQNVVEELVAAIVYIEFFIQAVTEENLRRAFLALLLSPQNCSELPLVTSLISHIHSPNVQLNLVVMNFFNTLISLHSEDAMIVLVFQYLTPCTHVMLSQRSKIPQPPFFAAERLLQLLPQICQHESSLKASNVDNCSNMDVQRSRTQSFSQQSSLTELESSALNSPSPFYEYLKEAKKKVATSSYACSKWAWMYNSLIPLPTEAIQMINASKITPAAPYTKLRGHSDPHPHSLPYQNSNPSPDCDKNRSTSLPNYISSKVDQNKIHMPTTSNNNSSKQELLNSKNYVQRETSTNSFISPLHVDDTHLDSLGESSGYDSFNLKGSRDSSPLHNKNTRKSNLIKDLSSNGLQEHSQSSFYETSQIENNEKSFEVAVDEDFLQFLERSQSPLHPEEDSFQIIEDAFVAVGVLEYSGRTSKYVNLSNADQEFDTQSQWLADSYSSLEDDANEDHKDLLNSHPKPTIGPFLEALISQVDRLLESSTHGSILAMSCLTNLACYPCPLITSLLLQPSVVLQPSVRSLYQALSQLKQKIDNLLTVDDLSMLLEARWRFSQTINLTEPVREQKQPVASSSFVRGGDKRRSFSQTLSAFFNLNTLTERIPFRESALQNLPDGAGYRYINAPSSPPRIKSAFQSASVQKQKAAICTIFLHEWLLELAALAQEHTVSSPSIHFRTLKQIC